MTELYASDLDYDTAFERLFLSTAFPIANTMAWQAAGTFDPATGLGHVYVSARDDLGTTPASAVALLGVQPLAFGAAWKALDTLLEHALAAAGLIPQNGTRWTIAEKVAKARQGLGHAEPLSNDPQIWAGLLSLYAGTEEIRHSLVHRRVSKRADGALIGITAQGSQLPALTMAQQEACCYAVQRALEAVIGGSISRRQRSDLAWHLDQLQTVHRQSLIGGRQVLAIRRFTVPLIAEQGRIQFDATQLKQSLGKPGAGQWIEVHFQTGGGGDFVANLDDIPDGVQSVNLAALPSWTRQV